MYIITKLAKNQELFMKINKNFRKIKNNKPHIYTWGLLLSV